MKQYTITQKEYDSIEKRIHFLDVIQEGIWDACQSKADDINLGFKLGQLWSMAVDEGNNLRDVMTAIYELEKEKNLNKQQ